MTPDIERYFPRLGQAKAYVDAHFNEIKKQQDAWMEPDADIPF